MIWSLQQLGKRLPPRRNKPALLGSAANYIAGLPAAFFPVVTLLFHDVSKVLEKG